MTASTATAVMIMVMAVLFLRRVTFNNAVLNMNNPLPDGFYRLCLPLLSSMSIPSISMRAPITLAHRAVP